MKNKLALLFVAVSLTVASCYDSETEILKQARTTQQGVLSKKQALLTDLEGQLKTAEQEISQISQTQVDSAGAARINELSDLTTLIRDLKDQVENWGLNLDIIPEAGEIHDDPKFKDKKDEDVLHMAKEQDSLFNILKSEVESQLL
jgi:hypothetical protein